MTNSNESVVVTPEDMNKAEAFKEQGNLAFKKQQWHESVDLYSKAIEINPKSTAYLGNRAFAHLKLENYGSCIQDAEAAIDIDPNYTKAYYRRGNALFCLGHYKKALADFKLVMDTHPSDKLAKVKYRDSLKAYKKMAFEEAIRCEDGNKEFTWQWENEKLDGRYEGPKWEGDLSVEVVEGFVEHFKKEKALPSRYLLRLLSTLVEQLRDEPSLVDVPLSENETITVCGDTHGQFYDTLNIFKLNGLPSPSNPYVFNGDFVDRGSFSVENVLTLFLYKALYPQHVLLTRGNHETVNMNKMYGFDGEIKAKYPSQHEFIKSAFTQTFRFLPLGVLIDQKCLVVHGGLFSKDGVTLDDIRAIPRVKEPGEDVSLMTDLLWSDPQPAPGRSPSKRGVGYSFGPDITRQFLQANNLKMLIRSHEMKETGYSVDHDGQCITVFSAPNYCDAMGNDGAYLRLGKDMKPDFHTFQAVPHPQVKAMAYSPLGMM
eukprot:GCRY01001080.1.p1 GENE.GCRY01001080.1~~GCRY01001080.1.p1  ORF type:complete len:486 (+),score=146.74 GCRY01001080.1:152-1609(+)